MASPYGRRVKCNINERRVRRHNEIQSNLLDGEKEEPVTLEFTCHDSSKGVTDFREWSYFKKLEKKKIVNIGNTHLWSKKYLEMLNERKIDSIKSSNLQNKKKKLPAIKTTKAQRMREEYNDQISASYKPEVTISIADASINDNSSSWTGNDSVFGARVIRKKYEPNEVKET